MLCIFFLLLTFSMYSHETLTPYKFKDYNELQSYKIPPNARFTCNRMKLNDPNIVFYMSKPASPSPRPYVILCGGSCTKNSIISEIHLHRYFLQECLDLNLGLITIERWGVDGSEINVDECMNHYTRTQRLRDHQSVLDHLCAHPPAHWDGTFIFIGVSEGGPLALSLTQNNQSSTKATIIWSGAGDDNWQEEVWDFIKTQIPFLARLLYGCISYLPGMQPLPITYQGHKTLMGKILSNPTFEKSYLDMTYAYHADAATYPHVNYSFLKTPLLAVTGAQDSLIHSSDRFIEKARTAEVPVTYLRVENMDHYVRKHPEVLDQSFKWLEKIVAA